MPTFSAKILNTEVEINYQENEFDMLKEAINKINEEIQSFNNKEGKFSDSKLIAFYTIKLQADLIHQKKIKNINDNLDSKNQETNKQNIILNDQVNELNNKIYNLKNENNLVNNELDKIKNQLDTIIRFIKDFND